MWVLLPSLIEAICLWEDTPTSCSRRALLMPVKSLTLIAISSIVYSSGWRDRLLPRSSKWCGNHSGEDLSATRMKGFCLLMSGCDFLWRVHILCLGTSKTPNLFQDYYGTSDLSAGSKMLIWHWWPLNMMEFQTGMQCWNVVCVCGDRTKEECRVHETNTYSNI